MTGSHLSADQNMCAMCHGESAVWEGETLKFYIPQEKLAEDVHWQKGVNCHDCHGGDPSASDVNLAHAAEDRFRANPAAIMPGEVRKRNACGYCHNEQALELDKGMHVKAGQKNEAGQGTLLGCDKCHGEVSHHLLPATDSKSPIFSQNQVQTCGACHQKDLATYNQSVHGLGLHESGLVSAAVCSDCHGAHGVYLPADKRSTLHTANVATTCGKCHRFIEERLKKSVHGGNGLGKPAARVAPGGKEKQTPSCTSCHQGHDLPDPRSGQFRLALPNRCGNCHAELSSRYAMSLHGQLTELGYVDGAKCSDCHGAHDILPVNDPKSRLAPANRVETCRKCHVYAVANFVQFDPHADHEDPQDPTHLVFVGMETLLFSVFGFFGVHAILWFVRSLVHTLRHGRPRRLVPRQPAYVRFEPIHRILHLIVIVSFLGLALTGLPLKYSDQDWAKTLARGMGGFDATSVLHHICAAATFFYFSAHLAWLVEKVVLLRWQGIRWRVIVFGPDSPVPNLRDVTDLTRMIRWFVGLGPKPVFERWAYWEKFDYWAVFWGVAIIGTSGLILWFPNLFTRFLPGEALNIAKIIHSEEALLATGFIFAIHFFHTHLRPEKYPMDLSVLTGLVSEAEMQDERPEFFERLRKEGALDATQVRAPSRRVLWFITAGGTLALAIGLFLLGGMILSGLGH